MRNAATNFKQFLSKGQSTSNLSIAGESKLSEDHDTPEKKLQPTENTSLKSAQDVGSKHYYTEDPSPNQYSNGSNTSLDHIEYDQSPDINIDEAINRAGLGLGTLLYVAGPYFISAFEGAEMAVLSVVVYMVLCSWDLNNSYVFLIQFCTIIGICVGSSACSPLSDKFGRRKILLFTYAGILLVGIFLTLAPNEKLYITYQFMVGFVLGGAIGPAAAHLVEVVPSRWRIAALTIKSVMKSIGTIVAIVFIFLLDDIAGWRPVTLVIHLAIIPAIVFLCISYDSPRTCVVRGEDEEAKLALTQLQSLNKKNLFKEMCYERNADDEELDNLVSPEPDLLYKNKSLTPVSSKRFGDSSEELSEPSLMENTKEKAATVFGRFYLNNGMENNKIQATNTIQAGENTEESMLEKLRSLVSSFKNKYSDLRLMDIALMIAYGFVVQAIYYGYTFYLPIIMKDNQSQMENPSSESNDSSKLNAQLCKDVPESQLLELAVTNLVGPLGSVIAAVCVIWVGRKRTGYVISVLIFIVNFYFYTNPSANSAGAFEIILTLTAILKCAADVLVLVVATEYFPTVHRGLGLSLCFSGGKFGAALSVIICTYGYDKSSLAVPLYLTALSVMMLFVILLTKETKGKILSDT